MLLSRDSFDSDNEDDDNAAYALTLRGVLFLGLLDWDFEEEKADEISEALTERVRDYAEKSAGEDIPAVLFDGEGCFGYFDGVQPSFTDEDFDLEFGLDDEDDL